MVLAPVKRFEPETTVSVLDPRGEEDLPDVGSVGD